VFISSTGDIANMIGCPGGYSRVEQPLPLLILGCGKNADDIFDVELSATIKQKNLKNEWSQKLCLPVDGETRAHSWPRAQGPAWAGPWALGRCRDPGPQRHGAPGPAPGKDIWFLLYV